MPNRPPSDGQRTTSSTTASPPTRSLDPMAQMRDDVSILAAAQEILNTSAQELRDLPAGNAADRRAWNVRMANLIIAMDVVQIEIESRERTISLFAGAGLTDAEGTPLRLAGKRRLRVVSATPTKATD